ncbi:MAG: radical SAM protein [Proteobacteria bacterium]|nr:radical SAM protein [Pseudomonadota bacterium]
MTSLNTTTCCCSADQPHSPHGRWVEMAVAPRANNRIRFAATSESQQAMIPGQALALLADILGEGGRVDGVTIAGPGDPLADSESTVAMLALVRKRYPEMALGITTLGLGGEKAVRQLVEAGVSHVTLLVDAVDLEVMQKLYAWIRPGSKTVPLFAATELLLSEQQGAVKAFVLAGCTVHVRTTIYPGYNDEHAVEIARTMAELGVQSMAVAAYDPEEGEEVLLEQPSREQMAGIREQMAKYLSVVVLPEKIVAAKTADGTGCGCGPRPSAERPNVAVVSSGGMEVDLHLGHAAKALIYGLRGDGLTCLLETRTLPEPGTGGSRWEILAETLKDCFVLLAASAGESPRKILGSRGISVLITDGSIEGTVDVLYGGGKKGKKCRK